MSTATAITQSHPAVYERIVRSASRSRSGGLCKLSFHAMGTTCRLQWRASGGEASTREFEDEVLRWVAVFEAKYSRFLPDSLIGRINAAAGEHWVETDPETENLLNLCGQMNFFSGGVFDPTALPLIRLWNWKARPPVIPTEEQLAAARELCGWNKVERRPGGIFLPRAGMCLDLGGIGKEYAVDSVTLLALSRSVENVLVDFGEDVRVNGAPPEGGAWRIGLEDPRHPGSCWTTAAVTNQAVATSGDYLRHFTSDGRRYGHIIDPRNGSPVYNHCLSVSIIAPACSVAGVLATSAFVLGPREGLNLISLCPGVEGCLISEHGRHPSRNFHAYATC